MSVLFRFVRVDDLGAHVLATSMHVGTVGGEGHNVLEHIARIHLMVHGARRNHQIATFVRQTIGAELMLGHLISQIEANGGMVAHFPSHGRVMGVQADLVAFGDEYAGAFGEHGSRFLAWRVALQEAHFSTLGRTHAKLIVWFDDAGNHVVNHGALGGTELYRLDPDIFLEGQVDDGVAVFDGAGGRYQEVLRIHHQVGFAQFPALGEAKAGQRVFGTVTPGCTGIDTVHQCLDIGVTDVAGIGEVVDVRVNLRRRHTLGHQRFADHGRPALDHLVAVHGKWADTAFAVARGTLFLEDRGYVGGVVG